MSQSIIFAKTARPSAAGVLPRERLFTRLDSATMAPVVWVQAPAGAGKTSALVSYLEARQRRGLWYQIDESDADPATFFSHAARAVGNGRQLPLFTAEYREDPGAFASQFFRQLAENLGGAFLIVLDNYHELAVTAPLHGLLRHGLAELPPECSLVAISREPPPPAFIRLRANRELQMLTWPDLRLTREEFAAIVHDSGHDIGGARLSAMHDATQGWAAALILMLDSDVSGQSTIGVAEGQTPELLFDYLAQEVFEAFEPGLRRLLLATAGVPEMTAELAVELSGDGDAERSLRALVERHHLVNVKPGAEGAVYQCHPLLREFLVRQAARRSEGSLCQGLRGPAAGLDRRVLTSV